MFGTQSKSQLNKTQHSAEKKNTIKEIN